MENIQTVLIGFAIAGALISFYAVARPIVLSPSAPSWLASTPVTCIVSLGLTLAFAGSLFYLGLALVDVMPGWFAFFGTFAIHIGLFALCQKLIPVSAKSGSRQAASDADTATSTA